MSGDTRRGLDRIGQMFVEVVGENERDRPQLGDSRGDPHPNGVVGRCVGRSARRWSKVRASANRSSSSSDRAIANCSNRPSTRVREYMDTQVQGLARHRRHALDAGHRMETRGRSRPSGVVWRRRVAGRYGGAARHQRTEGRRIPARRRARRSRHPRSLSARRTAACSRSTRLKINTANGLVPISSFVKRVPGTEGRHVRAHRRRAGSVHPRRRDERRARRQQGQGNAGRGSTRSRGTRHLRIEFKGANEEQSRVDAVHFGRVPARGAADVRDAGGRSSTASIRRS